jgi:membrane associated rhomboid family serine protease
MMKIQILLTRMIIATALCGLIGSCLAPPDRYGAASGWIIALSALIFLHRAERRIERLEAARLKHIDFLNGKISPRS